VTEDRRQSHQSPCRADQHETSVLCGISEPLNEGVDEVEHAPLGTFEVSNSVGQVVQLRAAWRDALANSMEPGLSGAHGQPP
jgi:hypothetical protein